MTHKVVSEFIDTDGKRYAVGDKYSNTDNDRLELLSGVKGAFAYITANEPKKAPKEEKKVTDKPKKTVKK